MRSNLPHHMSDQVMLIGPTSADFAAALLVSHCFNLAHEFV